MGGHKQRQSRVEAARDAHHQRVAVNGVKTAHEALGLYVHYFLAACVESHVVGGHKGGALDFALKPHLVVVVDARQVEVDALIVAREVANAVAKALVDAALVFKSLNIDVGHHHLRLHAEALAAFQDVAVF